jgi:hypothetical protein
MQMLRLHPRLVGIRSAMTVMMTMMLTTMTTMMTTMMAGAGGGRGSVGSCE